MTAQTSTRTTTELLRSLDGMTYGQKTRALKTMTWDEREALEEHKRETVMVKRASGQSPNEEEGYYQTTIARA